MAAIQASGQFSAPYVAETPRLFVDEKIQQFAQAHEAFKPEPLRTPRREKPTRDSSDDELPSPRLDTIRSISPSFLTLDAESNPPSPKFSAVPTGSQIPPLSPASREKILADSFVHESSFESPDACFFLRSFTQATRGVTSWSSLVELSECQEEVRRFYIQELQFRGLPVENASLDQAAQVESELQGHDRPNLSLLMDKILPPLCDRGHIYVPVTMDDFKRGGNKQISVDCFNLMWRITYCPSLLNRMVKLDFSGIGLKEIPLSFSRLCFPNLKKLSFANNPLKKLPQAFFEKVPRSKILYFLMNYPKLESLDLSDCELTSIEGVFSFSEERISVIAPIREVDFRGNGIVSFPKEFDISNRHGAPEVTLRFSAFVRKKPLVDPECLKTLAESAPVKIIFDLTEAMIVDADLPSSCPPNVTFKIGPIKQYIPEPAAPPPIKEKPEIHLPKRGENVGV